MTVVPKENFLQVSYLYTISGFGGPKREFFASKLFVHHFRVCCTVLPSVRDTIGETREFPRNIVSSGANTMSLMKTLCIQDGVTNPKNVYCK